MTGHCPACGASSLTQHHAALELNHHFSSSQELAAKVKYYGNCRSCDLVIFRRKTGESWTKTRSYPLRPIGKPRITHATRYSKTAKRYYSWRDEARLMDVRLGPFGCTIIFEVEMPRSWSEKKRILLDGHPHLQTPDVDNMVKAVLDAARIGKGMDDRQIWNMDDRQVWNVEPFKIWGRKPHITIHTDVMACLWRLDRLRRHLV